MAKTKLYKGRGQSTLEYGVVIAVVAAALIAMQFYVKRGLQGRIRNLADEISTTQYEPGRTDSNYRTEQDSSTTENYINGLSNTAQTETTTRSGNETVYPEAQ